ncbi:peptidoglycan-recognition protein LC-like isoform X1 [Photinus pyralis]|uniref:Peptidoglycan recognition protein family domain-containing protein n=1 Tax=Photinus pyralis TaxID=7054 RepID=A0A1Y1KQV4_PHOPY|nr:peptidoglycan-recognition protein LC-like isoform X1 [Photinus pyralis]
MSKITSLETSNSISDYEDEEQDTISVATSECSRNDQVILAEDGQQDQPNFGNIAVTNSTDIHFGNKTYYQGPVTIKQVLYANSKNSDSDGETAVNSNFASDNPGFVPDQFAAKVKVDGSDKVNVTETRQPKGTRWLQRFSRQHVLLITSLAVVLLMSLITLMVVLMNRHQSANNGLPPQYPKDSDEQDSGIPPDYPVDPSVNVTLPPKLKVIPRSEWLAQPPIEQLSNLVQPIPYVVISHTATDNCSEQAICKIRIRDLQSFQIEGKGLWDISYNFLVGGDGYAYEGRGWNYEGAHTFGYNSKSIGIAFVGTFHRMRPPPYQLLAAKQLIEKGIESGVLAKNYRLFGEKQLQDTLSPGATLYEEIKTWPKWTNGTLFPHLED